MLGTMRIADLFDYFRLRRHLADPAGFLRLRRGPPVTEPLDIPLRRGGAIRIRPWTLDRHLLLRALTRDEYRLGRPGVPLETVIDGGAHIGTFALAAAPRARRILCLEPDPESHALLAANTARLPAVEAVPAALGARSGRTRLLRGPEPSARSVMAPPPGNDPAGAVEVEVIGLEDLFTRRGIDRCSLLKLDVEGAEHEILPSIPRALWPRIDRIALEFHPVPGRPDWTPERLLAILAEGGHRSEIRRRAGKPRTGRIFSERGTDTD